MNVPGRIKINSYMRGTHYLKVEENNFFYSNLIHEQGRNDLSKIHGISWKKVSDHNGRNIGKAKI